MKDIQNKTKNQVRFEKATQEERHRYESYLRLKAQSEEATNEWIEAGNKQQFAELQVVCERGSEIAADFANLRMLLSFYGEEQLTKDQIALRSILNERYGEYKS